MPTGNGLLQFPSPHSVDETVTRVRSALEARGLTIFALIDHSGAAEQVGLAMPPTKVLLFGSPKAGTPPMLAAPTLAIDLPLKVLIWADASGSTRVAINDPAYLQQRHGFPAEYLANFTGATTLIEKALS